MPDPTQQGTPTTSLPALDLSKSVPLPTSQPSAALPKLDLSKSVPLPAASPAPQPQGDIIDRVIAGHPTLERINKGLEEGVMSGFGLKAPDPNNPESLSFSDIAEQTIHNVTDAARNSFHALGGNWDNTSANGIAGNVVATAAAPIHMVGAGIDSMASAIQDGAKELTEGLRERDAEKASRGFGKVFASASQIAGGAEVQDAAKVGGKVVSRVGEAVQDRAAVPGNSLLRATRKENFLYGKNPGQAFVDEKIAPPLNPTLQGQLENLQDQFTRASNGIDQQVRQKLQDPNVAAKTIDASAHIKQGIVDAKNKLSQQQGVADRAKMIRGLDDLQDELLNKFAASGQVVGTIDRTPLAPVEVSDLKKAIGRSTEWVAKTDPEYTYKNFVNGTKKAIYGKLNDAIEQVAPGTKDLNARWANVIEAQRLLENRLIKEGTNELGIQRLLARGEWLGALGALAAGSPMTAAPFIADRLIRSSGGRVIRARGADAVGRGLQNVGQSNNAATVIGAAAAASVVPPRVTWTASDGSLHSAFDSPDNRAEVKRIDPTARFHE